MIRLINPSDIPEVKSLIDSNFPRRIQESALLDTVSSLENQTYVLTDDDELIGTLGIRDNERLVWITSKYKRQGIARTLIQSVMTRKDYLYLRVKVLNIPAVTLYKSLGFTVKAIDGESFVMEWRKDNES